MKVNYLQAPAGSGKTHAMRDFCKLLVDADQNVLVVQPTNLLINETAEKLRNDTAVRVELIRADQGGKPVRVQAEAYFKAPNPDPHVLMMTHAGLKMLDEAEVRDWHLLIDEMPEPITCAEFEATFSHSLLTGHFNVERSATTTFWRVRPELRFFKDVLRSRDPMKEAYKEGLALLASPFYEVYVHGEQFQKLGAKGASLILYGILSPRVGQMFKSVSFYSASVQNSVLYHSWTKSGVNFVPRRAPNLRFTEHQNGELITIQYIFERHWSRYFFNQLKIAGRLPDLGQVVDLSFDGPFIWMGNNGEEIPITSALGRKVQPGCSGLNAFSHFHNVAYLTAVNPNPIHAKFLSEVVGMEEHEIRAAYSYESAYQAVLRTSIREPKDFSPKSVLVPSVGMAEFIAARIPGSRVLNIFTDMEPERCTRGRPKKHASSAARMATSRAANKLRTEEKLSSDVGNIFTRAVRTGDEETSCRGSISATGIDRGLTPDFFLSFEDFASCLTDVNLLRASATNIVPVLARKPAMLADLWLESRGGEMQRDFLLALSDHKVISYPTKANTKKTPNYIVMVALSRPVSPDEYLVLLDWLARRLADALVRKPGIVEREILRVCPLPFAPQRRAKLLTGDGLERTKFIVQIDPPRVCLPVDDVLTAIKG